MLLKDFMIALVIVGLVAFCVGGAFYSLNAEYNNATTNISLIDEYGKTLNDTQGTASSLYNITTGSSITAGGITGALFSGIGSFFQILIQAVTTPIRLITMTGETFGIPIQITLAVVTILVIAIVFAIISAILKKTP